MNNIKNIDNKAFIIIIGLIIIISILFALIFTFKKRKDKIEENIPLENKPTLKDVYILKEDSLKKIYLNKDSINNFDSTDIIRYFNEYKY